MQEKKELEIQIEAGKVLRAQNIWKTPVSLVSCTYMGLAIAACVAKRASEKAP